MREVLNPYIYHLGALLGSVSDDRAWRLDVRESGGREDGVSWVTRLSVGGKSGRF